jgi:hypothetical protein
VAVSIIRAVKPRSTFKSTFKSTFNTIELLVSKETYKGMPVSIIRAINPRSRFDAPHSRLVREVAECLERKFLFIFFKKQNFGTFLGQPLIAPTLTCSMFFHPFYKKKNLDPF